MHSNAFAFVNKPDTCSIHRLKCHIASSHYNHEHLLMVEQLHVRIESCCFELQISGNIFHIDFLEN